jgi:hypothetical protein
LKPNKLSMTKESLEREIRVKRAEKGRAKVRTTATKSEARKMVSQDLTKEFQGTLKYLIMHL